MIIEPLLDHETPWLCYRSVEHSGLVYFSCNKCASTLYDLLFEKLNWDKITTSDINWDNDFVFSYIRNPVVRHRKGIVEGIFTYYPYMKDVFANNQIRMKFLANITSIEAHSYSIHRMLGNKSLNMHWIPIDTEIDHKKETIELLRSKNYLISQDIENWFMSLEKVNESTVDEIDFYNQLSSIDVPPEILRYLDFDMSLYNYVSTPAPHVLVGEHYKLRINQLLSQGETQFSAEQIADSEVYSGLYKQWNFN